MRFPQSEYADGDATDEHQDHECLKRGLPKLD
jgi:hypothetical protein